MLTATLYSLSLRLPAFSHIITPTWVQAISPDLFGLSHPKNLLIFLRNWLYSEGDDGFTWLCVLFCILSLNFLPISPAVCYFVTWALIVLYVFLVWLLINEFRSFGKRQCASNCVKFFRAFLNTLSWCGRLERGRFLKCCFQFFCWAWIWLI